MSDQIPSELRQECGNSAVMCYGTGYIFDCRARSLRQRRLFLTFLGIAGPATLGAVVTTFALSKKALSVAIAVAGVIGIAQFILSIWSLVAKWDDRFAYYTESKSDNYKLAEEYAKLTKTQILNRQEFDLQYQLLETQAVLRKRLDENQHVTEREKRMGMRAGLRQNQRSCAGCKNVPTSLKSEDCDICGNF